MKGVDAIVHLGGVSCEKAWNLVLPANIVGTYNLYLAAIENGVKRIVYASSVHAIVFKFNYYIEII